MDPDERGLIGTCRPARKKTDRRTLRTPVISLRRVLTCFVLQAMSGIGLRNLATWQFAPSRDAPSQIAVPIAGAIAFEPAGLAHGVAGSRT